MGSSNSTPAEASSAPAAVAEQPQRYPTAAGAAAAAASSASAAPAPTKQLPKHGQVPVVDDKLEQAAASVKAEHSFVHKGPSSEKMPHYSRVVDPIETINPVTGRSVYYGARPWRCDDRFQDLLQSAWGFRGTSARIAWQNLWDCAYSEFGQQPTAPYETLGRQSVMYYVDRQDHGMIRDYMFERYPFSSRDFVRVMTDDGTKMRVWRHQRELELEAKQGRVDELVAQRAMPVSTKKNPNSVVG